MRNETPHIGLQLEVSLQQYSCCIRPAPPRFLAFHFANKPPTTGRLALNANSALVGRVIAVEVQILHTAQVTAAIGVPSGGALSPKARMPPIEQKSR